MNLTPQTQASLNNYVSIRKGETKIGEVISCGLDFNNEKIKYVLIGIPEDIGPIANYGKPGAKNSWKSFLKSFLNTQKNNFINTDSIHILGEVRTLDLYAKISEESTINDYQNLVKELDERVFEVITKIKSANKTPIVIGGGHNNCYPIIKAVSSTLNKPLNILNIDPHADLRIAGGRHSGNGFTYALNEKYINKYFVLGLHEEYNSEYIVNKINTNNNIDYYSYNKYLKESPSVNDLIVYPIEFLRQHNLGLEIDLDSIEYMPVSAKTPSGFSLETIRKIIINYSSIYNFEYIHICEGAPQNEEQEWIVGKAISYLVNDIIKTN